MHRGNAPFVPIIDPNFAATGMLAVQNVIRNALYAAFSTSEPNEPLIQFVAEFLEDHFLSSEVFPFEVQARFIEADDLPNVETQWGMYILFTWNQILGSNMRVSVSAMVKYWTEEQGDDDSNRIAFIIHNHPVLDIMGDVIHDSRYEWFVQQNSDHSRSLKDLLVVGKTLSGFLLPARPIQLILFHERYEPRINNSEPAANRSFRVRF
jgi:hypothetical protein